MDQGDDLLACPGLNLLIPGCQVNAMSLGIFCLQDLAKLGDGTLSLTFFFSFPAFAEHPILPYSKVVVLFILQFNRGSEHLPWDRQVRVWAPESGSDPNRQGSRGRPLVGRESTHTAHPPTDRKSVV